MRSSRRTARTAVLAVVLAAAGLGLSAGSSAAAVTSLRGSACGYFVNVGLFGGPQNLRGCGQPDSAPATSQSPSVTLPAGGSASPVTQTDADGAAGIYGPATIFGGIWPDDVVSAPPSGPITVKTQGTTGASGTVSSSADITLYATPPAVRCVGDPAGTANCHAPGGFGPPPVWGDSLHVECSASENAVSGLTRFSRAFLATATDAGGSPLPNATEAVPDSPPANYTKHGVITNVGDVFTVVFNEQIPNADGSLTVNAVHMYLFGPTAVGEVVKGQVTCGTTPTSVVPHDTQGPTCGVRVVAPNGPDDPTPKVPRQELIGTFDAGGLQSISNVQVTNGVVHVPPNGSSYLDFSPGQKGPLTITAVRTDAAESANLPLTWSVDAKDAAGNTSHCDGTGSPPTQSQTGTTTTTVPVTTSTVAGQATTTTTTSPATTTTTAVADTTTTTTVVTTTTTSTSTTVAGTTSSGTTSSSSPSTTISVDPTTSVPRIVSGLLARTGAEVPALLALAVLAMALGVVLLTPESSG